MGFQEADARAALTATGNVFPLATAWLLGERSVVPEQGGGALDQALRNPDFLMRLGDPRTIEGKQI